MTDTDGERTTRCLVRFVLPVGTILWAIHQAITRNPTESGQLFLLIVTGVSIILIWNYLIAAADSRLNGRPQ